MFELQLFNWSMRWINLIESAFFFANLIIYTWVNMNIVHSFIPRFIRSFIHHSSNLNFGWKGPLYRAFLPYNLHIVSSCFNGISYLNWKLIDNIKVGKQESCRDDCSTTCTYLSFGRSIVAFCCQVLHRETLFGCLCRLQQ